MRQPALALVIVAAAACSAAPVETTAVPPTTGLPDQGPATATTTTTHAASTTPTTIDHDGPSVLTITTEPGQTMRGWGFSIAMEEPGIEPLASGEMRADTRERAWDLLVGEAGINMVRVFSPGFGPGEGFEAENDNGDPRSVDLAAMGIDRSLGRLRVMRELGRRGVSFLLTGGEAPGWMTNGRVLEPAMAAEYAEHLVAFALVAGEETGVGFDWITAANEPDNTGMELQMDPTTSAAVIESLRELAGTYLPSTRLVVGDTVGWEGGGEYLDALAGRGLADTVAAVATHSYGSLRPRPAVAERAVELGLEVWMTERAAGGGDDCRGDDPGMGSALQWSDWIAGDVVEGRASVWMALRGVADLCHDPQGGLLVYDSATDTLSLPKRYYAFRQYARAGVPGSVVIASAWAGEGDAGPVVAYDRGDTVAVVVTNPAPGPLQTELSVPWVEASVVEIGSTNPGAEYDLLQIPAMTGGWATITLPPRSVNTIVVDKEPD